MKALRDNIIIDKIAEETKSASGLILTGTASDSLFNKGIVLSFGEEANGVEVGDTIIYMKSQEAEIIDDGSKLFVISYKHVVAVK